MRNWWPFAVMFVVGSAAGILGPRFVQIVPTSPGAVEQSGDAVATTMHDEIRALRRELAALHASPGGNADAGAESRGALLDGGDTAPSQAATGPRTLAYWNELNAVMAKEAAMRAAPPQITAENALSFVSGRSQAFRFAAPAIRGLNSQGVDPQVVVIARDIAAWYEAGQSLGQEAESLLGTNDVATRKGQRGSTWKTSEEQHRQQCLEINRHGEQVRQAMSAKYRLDFPKLL